MIMVSFSVWTNGTARKRSPVGRVSVCVDKRCAPPKRIRSSPRLSATHTAVPVDRAITERQPNAPGWAQMAVARPMTTCTGSSVGVSPALTSASIRASVSVRRSSGRAATQLIEPM